MIGCVLLSHLLCARSDAQPVTESVVAVSESVGYEIDPAERAKYSLFAEYGGFLRAEVVSKREQYWLRITHQRDKDRLVEQVALSDAELQELRDAIRPYPLSRYDVTGHLRCTIESNRTNCRSP